MHRDRAVRDQTATELFGIPSRVDLVPHIRDDQPSRDAALNRIRHRADMQNPRRINGDRFDQHLRVDVRREVEFAVNADPLHRVGLHGIERHRRPRRDEHLCSAVRNRSVLPSVRVVPIAAGDADERRRLTRHEREQREMFVALRRIIRMRQSIVHRRRSRRVVRVAVRRRMTVGREHPRAQAEQLRMNRFRHRQELLARQRRASGVGHLFEFPRAADQRHLLRREQHRLLGGEELKIPTVVQRLNLRGRQVQSLRRREMVDRDIDHIQSLNLRNGQIRADLFRDVGEIPAIRNRRDLLDGQIVDLIRVQ